MTTDRKTCPYCEKARMNYHRLAGGSFYACSECAWIEIGDPGPNGFPKQRAEAAKAAKAHLSTRQEAAE